MQHKAHTCYRKIAITTREPSEESTHLPSLILKCCFRCECRCLTANRLISAWKKISRFITRPETGRFSWYSNWRYKFPFNIKWDHNNNHRRRKKIHISKQNVNNILPALLGIAIPITDCPKGFKNGWLCCTTFTTIYKAPLLGLRSRCSYELLFK